MKLFDKYQWLTSCTGIEIHLMPDNSAGIRICPVSSDGDQLTVGEKKEYEDSLEVVVKEIPAGYPLAVCITGKGVVTKKTDRVEVLNENNLQQVFPNLALNDFYVQNFVSGEHSFISIVRREIIDQITGGIAAVKSKILLISLGPFVASQIMSQLNNYGEEIKFNGHHIFLSKDHEWQNYRYEKALSSEFTLKVGIEPLPETHILAYAAAFQLLLFNHLEPVITDTAFTSHSLNEFREEKKFRFRLTAILAALFTLLLLNFILFNSYSAANEKLLAGLNQNTSGIENMQKKEREIAMKEKQLAEIGWNKGMRYAYIADQLGQSVPAAVLLNELVINPSLNKREEPDKKISYANGEIQVRGLSREMRAVNEWIYQLKDKSWVKQVLLENYAPAQEPGEEDRQEFSLKVFY